MAQIIRADMDEMVFEGRERRYGAYYLRKKYPSHVLIGTAIICFLMFLFGFGPMIFNSLVGETQKKNKTMAISIKMEDLPPPPPMDEDQPPPPPKTPPPQVKTVSFQIPEPAPEEEVDENETIKEMEELKDAPNIGLEDKEGAEEGFFTGEIDATGEPEVIVDNTPKIDDFIFAEEEPKPVNMDDIKKLVGYPPIARDAGIQGQVVVRVLVDKKGNYSKHRIINQVHPVLAKAVEEHIAKLRFTPAIQGGKPIQFWVNIPFNFKLLDN
ncbi:MAG: energy transducer TonB [Bacteroidia bacterium]|nr:energy transducer TonB [Bacteroidia bacterium]